MYFYKLHFQQLYEFVAILFPISCEFKFKAFSIKFVLAHNSDSFNLDQRKLKNAHEKHFCIVGIVCPRARYIISLTMNRGPIH